MFRSALLATLLVSFIGCGGSSVQVKEVPSQPVPRVEYMVVDSSTVTVTFYQGVLFPDSPTSTTTILKCGRNLYRVTGGGIGKYEESCVRAIGVWSDHERIKIRVVTAMAAGFQGGSQGYIILTE